MRRVLGSLVFSFFLAMPLYGQGTGLKVFISVDMEGVTSVTNSPAEMSRTGQDYGMFRRLMTQEASAAVEGALAAGATEVVVRDAHGTARNILPELLHPGAKLLRDWSGGPGGMMEGIDGSFDAVVFIGYHAKAGTPNALLEHTSSGNVLDFAINGISMPEAGYNGLIAGYFGVPVVLVAGDSAICHQARELFGEVETVAVKKGIGAAALSVHPEVAQEMIRDGVQRALEDLDRFRPYILDAPYTLTLSLKTETSVYNGSFFPGARRTGDWEITYTANDLMQIMYAFSVINR